MTTLVVDTHAILWFLENDNRLSRTAARSLDEADHILLPSICLVEITYLVEKGRLQAAVLPRLLAELDRADTTLSLASLDLGIVRALQHVSRTQVPDMPDRIIAATAFFYNVPLVTRDDRIRSSGIEALW